MISFNNISNCDDLDFCYRENIFNPLEDNEFDDNTPAPVAFSEEEKKEIDLIQFNGDEHNTFSAELSKEFVQSLSENKGTNYNTIKVSQPKIFKIVKMPIIQKIQKQTKEGKKQLGRKRLSDRNRNEAIHTKYDYDNCTKKIRGKSLECLREFTNEIMSKEAEMERQESGDTNTIDSKKKGKIQYETEFLLKIDPDIANKSSIAFNKALLNMTLREIFSNKVCQKDKSHGLYRNKELIVEISRNPKRKRTNEILNMTFLQSLEHFRGTKYYEVLQGLELKYKKLINQMKTTEDEYYINTFVSYLLKYEELLEIKRAKKGRIKYETSVSNEFTGDTC